MFTREAQLKAVRENANEQLTRVGLIARDRGEVIVRRWNDETEALKAKHAQEVARFQVLLKEGRRLQRISNQKIVELENEIKVLRKRWNERPK
jgi:hypothetical protein